MPTADRANFIQLQHPTPEKNVVLVVLIILELAMGALEKGFKTDLNSKAFFPRAPWKRVSKQI